MSFDGASSQVYADASIFPSSTRRLVDSVSVALRSVAVQHWLSVLAVLSSLVIPVLGITLLRHWSHRKARWQGTAIWLSGCLSLLVYGCAAFIFGVCAGGEIGESGKQRLARAYGTPVVNALERYHQARRAYPPALRDLVGPYLSAGDLAAPATSVLGFPFYYSTSDSASYVLLVRFVGPGMNDCLYTPQTRWRCRGYF